LILLGSLFLLSCAHVISKETREVAVRDVSFRVARMNTEKYTGSVFIWGGFIANIKRVEEGTLMEVVQNPIDRYGIITDTDVSGGRFLAMYKGELDPLIYERGRLITIAGELTGTKKLKQNGDYAYPVLEVREVHLWKEEQAYYPYYQDRYYYPPYFPHYPWWPYYGPYYY
jgi:outer membrane lipoprotein